MKERHAPTVLVEGWVMRDGEAREAREKRVLYVIREIRKYNSKLIKGEKDPDERTRLRVMIQFLPDDYDRSIYEFALNLHEDEE
jgi:hypothetical protein